MKNFFFTLMLTVIIFLNSDLAFANKNQRQRVRQGIKSGQITKGEAHKIRQKNHEHKKGMHQMRKDAKADGQVTKDEKMQMRKARRHNRKEMNKQIHKSKHNTQKRLNGPPRGSKPSGNEAPLEEIPVENEEG